MGDGLQGRWQARNKGPCLPHCEFLRAGLRGQARISAGYTMRGEACVREEACGRGVQWNTCYMHRLC